MSLPCRPEDFDRYDGLIFDLDGTLINSMPYHIKAWKQTAQERGFSIEDDFIYQRGGFSSRNIVRDMRLAGHETGDVDSFVARKVELYRMNMPTVEVFPLLESILKRAKSRGAGIAVGTGTQRINAVDILKLRNLSEYVDFIVSADDVELHKPHPQTYLKACELMGISPEQCVVFEDGKPGIDAAEAARMDCVIVDNGRVLEFRENSKLSVV